ncbi:50S ribosomal protein L14 [bacterium]|nr:50S ribosomal protein L14 [bacterium]
MIQQYSRLKVADNTGALELQMISVLGYSKKKYARVGDIISASVKKVAPQSQIKKGKVVKALIVRQKKEWRREDGSYVRFDDNAAVILTDDLKDIKGTRIFGPIPREIRDTRYKKIISLAKEII